MKKYILYLIAVYAFLSSCDDMMDKHKSFIEGGEKVYTQKLDEFNFYAGKNQIYFRFYMANTANVKSVDLYWDEDSLIIPMPSHGWNLVTIPATEEKAYTFRIRTTDVFGHHSLWSTGFGNSYGDYFQESLINRSVKSFSLAGDNGEITWLPPASRLVRTEVRYTDATGTEQVIDVPSDQNVTQCPGLNSNRFSIRSFFLPEEEALDTFAVAWTPVNPAYKLPTTLWTTKYCNSWHGMPALTGTTNQPHHAFDGNYNTFWHSRYTTFAAGTSPLDPTITRDPCPMTLVIDLGEPIEIMKVDVYRRFNNNNTQTVAIYVPTIDDELLSDADFEWLGPIPITYVNHSFFKNYSYPGVENDNWQELGRIEYPSDNNFDTPEKNLRSVDASGNVVKTRYLKLVLPNSRSNANVSISEIAVHGR